MSVPGYLVKVYYLNANQFGLPQNRQRVYVIFLHSGLFDAQCSFKRISLELDHIKEKTGPYPPIISFLADSGCPVQPQLIQSEDERDVETQRCSCRADTVCLQHHCPCKGCRIQGAAAKACRWRAHLQGVENTKRYMLKSRKYLEAVKLALKNDKLNKAPCYFQLASCAKLAAKSVLKTPRVCTLLKHFSQIMYLMNDSVVMDVSQSVHRAGCRCDSQCPALGTSSRGIFSPARCRFLTAQQALQLQGITQDLFDIQGFADSDLRKVAGNGMAVPVLSAVMAATLRETEGVSVHTVHQ